VDLEIRPVSEQEFPAFSRSVEAAFGHHADDDEVADQRSLTELERTLAAFEDGRIVATAAAISFELSLPGAVTIPAAGVTAVGVRPSHHRRGLLRTLMEQQLDDVADRHEAVAILTASESIIYGRFGYGVATSQVSLAIDPRYGGFVQPLPDAGRMQVLEPEEVIPDIPAIHDRARLAQPGDIDRNGRWWDLAVRDPEWSHKGLGQLFWAMHRSPAGECDGYVSYRVKPRWAEGLPDWEIQVNDLVGLDAIAEAALWRFVLDLDLASRVVAPSRPVDEALRWRLADPRRLRVTSMVDHLWVRLLDIPSALAARRYGREIELVLEVGDGFRPSVGGRFLLCTGRDGAVCEPTARPADLSLGAAELGAVYLGHPRLTMLGRAGRAVEHTPGALHMADQLFASDTVPFCRTGF
jgi:predicted acetyltransferase